MKLQVFPQNLQLSDIFLKYLPLPSLEFLWINNYKYQYSFLLHTVLKKKICSQILEN